MTATVTNIEDERTIREGEAAASLYKSSNSDARAQIIPMAMGLLAARNHYSADKAFGKWLNDSPYKEINPHDRTALIKIGDNAQIAMSFLQTTTFSSPQLIWKALKDLPEVCYHSKPPRRRSAPRKKIEPIGVAEMPPKMQQRYEAALKKAKEDIRRELKSEVVAEVKATWDGIIEHYTKKLDQADRITHGFRGFIPREQFRMILACLHPDVNKFEHAAEAFRLFKGMESILVKLDPPVNAPPLPKTASELMAKRKSGW